MMRFTKAYGAIARLIGATVVAGCGGQAAHIVPTAAHRRDAGASIPLARAVYPAFPDVTADGTRGFDTAWVAHQSVFETHLERGASAWAPIANLGAVKGQAQATIDVAPTGAAVIAWTPTNAEASTTVEMRYRRTFDGPWGPLTQMTDRRGLSAVRVATDARGEAYVAWRSASGITLATHPSNAARGWQSPRVVIRDRGAIPSQPGRALALATSPSGELAVAWEDQVKGGMTTVSRSLIHLRVRSRAGQWSSPTYLGAETSPPMQGDTQPQSPVLGATFGSNSRIFVTWQAATRQGISPRIASLSASGGWGRPRELTVPRAGQYPVIAADDRNLATVLWTTSNGTIQSATLSPSGSLSKLQTLGSGGQPTVVADGAGRFAAVWNGQAAYRTPHGWCPRREFGEVSESSVAMAADGQAEIVLNRHNTLSSLRLIACSD